MARLVQEGYYERDLWRAPGIRKGRCAGTSTSSTQLLPLLLHSSEAEEA
ncbi:hypothetical protein [Entomobacter blattae]|uniref:Uncharacterized protein n=1 Tax=Entomobacter blattae TaxID=2762277 RepID=A0A7H1NQ45_9PROT|nr:hypothetical protein [Entomobacter blattae]QNT77905.1 hypothetical protein JGUZn3_06630 [Entomobacter blattae]